MLRAVKSSPPPPPSPARDALADAIENFRACERELTASQQVFSEANRALWAAIDKRDSAQEAVKNAPANTVAHMTATAKGDAGTAPPSPAEARAALTAAEEMVSSKRKILDEIKNQRQPDKSWALDRCHRAAAAVVAESPELQKLIADVEEAQRRLIEVARPLAFMYLKSILTDTREDWGTPANRAYKKMQQAPNLWDFWRNNDGEAAGASGATAAWMMAWQTLLTDATAPLPASK